jgi:hypothetical protein
MTYVATYLTVLSHKYSCIEGDKHVSKRIIWRLKFKKSDLRYVKYAGYCF